jgi:tripartite-type tricarboxylate transporter receptor subunit TctC
MQRRDLLRLVAAAGVLPAALARAQSDVKTILVGFAPGTATDAVARILGQTLTGRYASNLIVENKVGASGQLAVMAAKAAAPDSSTMLVCPMTVLAVYPYTFAHLGYDPVADLQPVGNCTTVDLAFAVAPAVPASVTSVPQFIAWCKANPAKASFATGATGSKLHFAGIELGLRAGVKLTHVGYSNGGVAVTDLIGGNVPSYIGTVPTVLPYQKQLRILATMGAKRSRFLPDVPTLVEAGYKDLVVNETIGLYLPAHAGQEQVQQLHAAMVQAMTSKDAAVVLNAQGMEASPSGPAQLARQLRDELAQWGPMVKRIGFRQNG